MATRIPIDPSGAVVSRYLERSPEKLVVEGLRRWMQGCERGSIDCWERAANLYAEELGITEGSRVLAALALWVDTLRTWMDRPAGLSPSECPRLCRDECFAVTMIAACQNRDDESLAHALGRLVPAEGRADVVRATRAFADALAETGQILIPVPGAVIREIGTRPCRRQFH
jgi:alkylhydroperoxidase/carboxymuconolactone decarboxylase family protein YurZ